MLDIGALIGRRRPSGRAPIVEPRSDPYEDEDEVSYGRSFLIRELTTAASR